MQRITALRAQIQVALCGARSFGLQSRESARWMSTEIDPPNIRPLPAGFRIAQAIKMQKELEEQAELEQDQPPPLSTETYVNALTGERGGPRGPEPTRYGKNSERERRECEWLMLYRLQVIGNRKDESLTFKT
jgi:hypothetical protein